MTSDTRELLDFIKNVGIDVEYSDEKILIENRHQKTNASYAVMTDISEAFTYLTLSAFHNVDINLTNITVGKLKKAARMCHSSLSQEMALGSAPNERTDRHTKLQRPHRLVSVA